MPKAKDKDGNSVLTEKEKAFCREYIYDWNATRSYLKAYPRITKYMSAAALASKLLKKVKIQNYISKIQQNLEKTAGISRLKVIDEFSKIAFSSIAHLHNTWIERREFDQLSEREKAAIQEISTKTLKISGADDIPVDVEYVKIKLYDKQAALENINKMLGYNEPEKHEVTGKDGSSLTSPLGAIPIIITTPEQAKKLDEKTTDNTHA